MDKIITITAFSVVLPFAVGVALSLRRRLNHDMVPIVLLCGVWFIVEVLSYLLRVRGMANAFLSYFLTPVEIFLFVTFFFRMNIVKHHSEILGWSLTAAGVLLTLFDYIFIGGALNTYSLAFEFGLVAFLSVYCYYFTDQHPALVLTLLFYTLTSFPYFFAYDWLRINNVSVLMTLGSVYAYTHTFCYFMIAIIVWKSSTSSAVHS